MDGNHAGIQSENEARKASLGESLIAARQRRGLSREAAVVETHIPAHYVQMLEDDDYCRISDQLYLLPFLRKYASFLEMDQDETAMRLLREVQRAESNPSPARLDEPIAAVHRKRRRNWGKPVMFGGLVAIIIGAYIVQPHHNDTTATPAPKLEPSVANAAAPSSIVTGTLNPPAANRSVGQTSGKISDPTAAGFGQGTRATSNADRQLIIKMAPRPVTRAGTPGR
ncbi:MAG TPA: helix-turn-helix domain-containing protein [Candidatus Binataceae bacterium]|nr:helix-turn-helix domain-containing protein [Candidatus Binataceae bacterium]